MMVLVTCFDTANYINQGGRRQGSFAIYLEPWHPDIMDFLELKKNHGNESDRARDLFYALWLSDLFMDRVEKDEMWSLFCPNKAKKLTKQDIIKKFGHMPPIKIHCSVLGMDALHAAIKDYEKNSSATRSWVAVGCSFRSIPITPMLSNFGRSVRTPMRFKTVT